MASSVSHSCCTIFQRVFLLMVYYKVICLSCAPEQSRHWDDRPNGAKNKPRASIPTTYLYSCLITLIKLSLAPHEKPFRICITVVISTKNNIFFGELVLTGLNFLNWHKYYFILITHWLIYSLHYCILMKTLSTSSHETGFRLFSSSRNQCSRQCCVRDFQLISSGGLGSNRHVNKSPPNAEHFRLLAIVENLVVLNGYHSAVYAQDTQPPLAVLYICFA